MDISVKKLSEILKIDPNALLEKMISAGLPQKNIEDLVSTEDKQALLSFIRSSKDSPVQEKKVEVPKELTPKKETKKKTKEKSKSDIKEGKTDQPLLERTPQKKNQKTKQMKNLKMK